MTDTRIKYISKAKEKLDSFNARIVEIEAKTNEKTGEAREELKLRLTGIRESRAKAKRRLTELRLASKPAWADAKKGVEQAWHSLSDAIDSAGKRLQ